MSYLSYIKIISYLDKIGIRPRIYVFGKPRFNTFIGSLCTIISFSLFALISIYFLAFTFQRNGISLIYRQSSLTFPEMPFDKFPFMVAVKDSSGIAIQKSENLFSVFLILRKLSIDKEYLDEIFEMEQCDIHKHFGNYENLFSNIPSLDNFQCVKNNRSFTLDSRQSDIGFPLSFFSIAIGPCSNISNNNPSKLSNGHIEMNNRMKRVNLKLYSIDFEIDHRNADDPIIPYIKEESNIFEQGQFREKSYEFQKVSYHTDSGFIFENFHTDSFYQKSFHSSSVVSDSYYDQFWGMMTFALSESSADYYRSFTKIHVSLAFIGGFAQIIFTISRSLTEFFGMKSYEEAAINESFFHESNSVKKLRGGIASFGQRCDFQKDITNKMNRLEIHILKQTKQKAKLHCIDYLFNAACSCCPTSNLRKFHELQMQFRRKISIDNLLLKLNELEKLKFIIFDDEQQLMLRSLGYYNDTLRRSNQTCISRCTMNSNYNNTLVNHKLTNLQNNNEVIVRGKTDSNFLQEASSMEYK